jgi:alpha-glucosidase
MKKLIYLICLIGVFSCSENRENFEAVKLIYTGDNVIKAPKGYPSFYSKYINANGIPILGSENVQDEAFVRARHTIINMLAKRPDVLAQMILHNTRAAIVADEEETADLPEYSDVEDKEYFSKRGRGYGGTLEEPFSTCGEENIMRVGHNLNTSENHRADSWNGYDVLVHEFAHSIHLIGLRKADKDFQSKLEMLYSKALNNPLWKGTYAMSNEEEYFAEATQRWFNAVTDLSDLQGLKQEIYTREQLKEYDPEMYELLKTIYYETQWKPLPFPKE